MVAILKVATLDHDPIVFNEKVVMYQMRSE